MLIIFPCIKKNSFTKQLHVFMYTPIQYDLSLTYSVFKPEHFKTNVDNFNMIKFTM